MFLLGTSVAGIPSVASTCAPAAAVTPVSSPEGTRSQRWLARLSFLLAGGAIVILVVFAGLKSVAMLAVGLAAAAVSLAAAFAFLSHRGIRRWLSLVVFVLAPIAVIVVYTFRDLLWVAVASAAAWLLATVTAPGRWPGNQRTGGCLSIRRSRLPGTRT